VHGLIRGRPCVPLAVVRGVAKVGKSRSKEGNMARLIGIILLTILAAAVFVSTAVGDPPTRQPVAYPSEPFVLGDFCGFPVQATILQNNQTQTVYQDGRQTVTGTLKVRLTNTQNGKSFDSNISGPVIFTPNADGSFTAVFGGRSLIFPNDMNVMFISAGRVIMRVNRDMTFFSLLSVTGTTFDVCAALR
jgi:hypothetical protein